ncbi:MAG: hypothetical protein AAFA34_02255 [Thermoplasmata archaeon]|jgi:hypothetical protein
MSWWTENYTAEQRRFILAAFTVGFIVAGLLIYLGLSGALLGGMPGPVSP